MGDDVAQRLLGCRGIVTEPHGGIPVEPTAGILQGLRQIPVVERCVRRDAMLQASLGEPAVKVHAGWLRSPAPPGKIRGQAMENRYAFMPRPAMMATSSAYR